MPRKYPAAFHEGYNNDYRFILKDLAEEFENEFNCLEITEKYISFTVLIEKEVTISEKTCKKLQKSVLNTTIF